MVNPHRRTHHSSGMQSLLWHCLCHLCDFLICNLFLTKNAPLFSSSARRADTKPWSRSYEGVATLKKSQKRICFYLLFLLCLVTKGRLKFARPLCFLWLGGGQRRWADAWLRDATKTKSQQCSRRTACKHDMKLFTLICFQQELDQKNNEEQFTCKHVCFCFLWILKGKKPWACKIRVTYVSNQLSEKWTLTLLSIISFTAIGLRTARYVLHL